MNYSVKNKKHSFDFLYPYAARALGLKNLIPSRSMPMEVTYSSNQFCGRWDNGDNAVHKVTVTCRIGDDYVKFMPYRTSDAVESYGYFVYVNGKRFERLTPTEWAVIRPKVYGHYTEYFTEMDRTIAAYQKLYREKKSTFILSQYQPYLCSFRDALPNITADAKYMADPMFKPVSIKFNSDSIYGVPVHEEVAITKTVDNKLMISTYSLN